MADLEEDGWRGGENALSHLAHYGGSEGSDHAVNASIHSIKHTFPPSDGNTGISDIWSCLNSYIAYGCFPGC